MADQTFYLGRWADDQTPVSYEPEDLTTHAVVIGMTGSGKTGLLISILEEAIRQGLPAVVIDPKGDLTNLLLHFENLAPADFAPWLDEEAARRAGVSVDELAAQTAEKWRKGLADWNLGPDQIRELSNVDYSIYTPGSTAGTPVSLLSSFQAPNLNWDENREVLREQISSTVSALLGLVGISEIDPLRSREHILLANLIENAWSQGQSLDLGMLIEQVQSPPIERLGAFSLDRFFPEKDRVELAMILNNFLASPSFETWMEGAPLDAKGFLYGPNSRPKVSIFYLAHLDESERMFFVTLLLSAVETWMRAQKGTGSLRALLAFDEITGYLPPIENPPSRPVLLRLLKQARAFGLGLVLATQNPTDLNYKALSNAGSWFIGRLQTERDKERLLDGLQSLENGIDRAAFDRLASALKPRVFLLHNVHTRRGPSLFSTRWVMNFLAGPMTRAQIPALKKLWGEPEEPAAPARPQAQGTPAYVPAAAAAAVTPQPQAEPRAATPKPAASQALVRGATSTRPAVNLSPAAEEVFLPITLTLQKAMSASGGAFVGPLEPQGILYRPALIFQAQARYNAVKYRLQHSRTIACMLLDSDRPDWSGCMHAPFDAQRFTQVPAERASYIPLPSEWETARAVTALQKDFIDWVCRTESVELWVNEALKIYSAPNADEAAFRAQVRQAMVSAMQPEIDKTAASFDDKLEALKRKIEKQQSAVDKAQDEVSGRKTEQVASIVDFAAGIFGGRKRSISSSLSKNRMMRQAENDLAEAKKTLESLKQQWQPIVNDRQAALQRVSAAWQAKEAQVTRVQVTPFKKDVFTDLSVIAWVPYYAVKGRDGVYEVRAWEG